MGYTSRDLFCMTTPSQGKQFDWAWQWERFEDREEWLFRDWMYPNTMDDFREKRVMDAGCGGGQHVSFIAPYAKHVVGVDLNATHVASQRTQAYSNVEFVDADIATVTFPEPFDVVYCIGVIHHTDDPDRTFANLARLTKPGGRTIVWAYSHEGNFLVRIFVEGLKILFLLKLSKSILRVISTVWTACLYLPVYTLYLLPFPFLPYYTYFQNFRKLSFARNDLNVFDKLNAPQTHFIRRERIQRWFDENGFTDIHISPYRGVSWRGSGTKR